jgi:hypothetical protein
MVEVVEVVTVSVPQVKAFRDAVGASTVPFALFSVRKGWMESEVVVPTDVTCLLELSAAPPASLVKPTFAACPDLAILSL